MECHGIYILKISPVAALPVVEVPLLALLPEHKARSTIISPEFSKHHSLFTSMSSSILTKSNLKFTLSLKSLGKQESRVALSSASSWLSLKYSPKTMVKKITKDNRSQQGGIVEKDRRAQWIAKKKGRK
ncbi:hypothetical protein M9H77_01903 [Catharanthus roseus]|uniref:Uncharacterized protein n=1 Tax=Catharanthus roseus TaxID=4058 RepID=A0ACC0C6X9_CATRO|nr:hypothetical protein M9H77_01903 [Catharanthus roseus]